MARTKSSACSAMRISKTACRKKQDDRLQSGDGRFLYPQYNYTICNHEIFRRYSGAAGGGGFTPHGLHPQQRVSGSAVPAACRRRRDWLPMGRLGIAAVWRRRCRCSPAGYAVPTARGKRGQGHRMVPLPPLDSPKPSFALTHRRCAAKRGLRGLGSGRRFAFGTLSGPEFTLRKPQRCQCAARQCRALDLRCEKLCFDQACTLGAANASVGPSLLDARPKGVASEGGFVGVKRGQGNHTVP